ncbi:E3 ubiquitin-protein ligase NRDP1-like [Amphibalanus amphitrite]|uniref:E3 ubiquitin-protein ligase NRDP1-like n=1 Tax=Amphibalanus amphitrite TaxID=1232801 RepID=UPI001C90CBD4|nr:E3 ubiquitin-protein ligase NRDP1-like [Amphibalanus amphitrite]XP_043203916.1 E3 ubiquitin-protein ligase NRDP1-like [Amphibalanus amphitrite]XP_043203917.1 E3 ubiquitin-protein ligase NRDP1-like [Amphibalanus amphitrite]XP_043203918.1 E3 ubiquitin-protein ligase NRDP1-like [Amphibalanus amphitrite]XP_043203919.1 E3 ubiquitin-protein ligase NRDP1-like [Amphibalanus amphitrite]XP_043210388.1 E3 ubiquitin-protein ligase NRDP1-like [Amphibalanus amphitrite]XP_043210389.1 E3 ubiquitin-protein
MGIDSNRFEGPVDEELICPICSSVLEDPVQAPACEHAFCRGCITEWLSRQQICPVDRQEITAAQLKPVPRILRNLLARLLIVCDNQQYGCTVVINLDRLESHLKECEHNPKRPVQCEQGCGMVVPMDEVKEHNCVRELRALVERQNETVATLQQELADNKFQIGQLNRELNLVKEFMHAMRGSDPRMRTLADRMEQDEVVRWSASLPRARVTRWGGMISTPDAVLKVVIQRALCESGSPPHIIEDLMDNSHERRWPTGLSTLETRQANRRHYENYVCRRIPGKQAVIVMACENQHMNEDMILEPGLVLIFAHGVETDANFQPPA